MMHKLLPLEITPFPVDFEGVAGLALQDTQQALAFSPDVALDYTLPTDRQVGRFDLFAKGVVTHRDLDRDVGVQKVVLRKAEDRATAGRGRADQCRCQRGRYPPSFGDFL